MPAVREATRERNVDAVVDIGHVAEVLRGRHEVVRRASEGGLFEIHEAADLFAAAIRQSGIRRGGDAETVVIPRRRRPILGREEIAEPVPRPLDVHHQPFVQLMLQADQQLAVVGPDVPAAQDVRVPCGDDVGVAQRRAQGEAFTVRRREGQIAIRDEIAVGIEPRPGRAVDARIDRVVRGGRGDRLAGDVLAVIRAEHRLAVGEQIPGNAGTRRDVLPRRRIRRLRVVFRRHELQRRDAQCRDVGVVVVEPRPEIERDVLNRPAVLRIQPERRLQLLEVLQRSRVLRDRGGRAVEEAPELVLARGVGEVPRSPHVLHADLERVAAGDVVRGAPDVVLVVERPDVGGARSVERGVRHLELRNNRVRPGSQLECRCRAADSTTTVR